MFMILERSCVVFLLHGTIVQQWTKFGTYVSVKYQLNDFIVQHIDKCNPLFIKAILKEVNQVAWAKTQHDFLF